MRLDIISLNTMAWIEVYHDSRRTGNAREVLTKEFTSETSVES